MKLKALDDRKIQILDKLAEAGADTEKKLSELGMGEAFVIAEKSNVQLQDLHLISELQSAIKRRRLYAYLTSGIDEKEEKDGTGRTVTGNRAGESEDESNEDGIEGNGSEVDLGAPRLY